jgi:uncharacterized membrane protein YgcG
MKRQKRTLLTFALLGLLVYVSCKKTDYQQKAQTTLNSIEEKFFNTHRTSDPTEKALVDYLKRQNEKLHFVEKTVKQIGFPRWDKAIVKGKLNSSGRSSSIDSSTTFYIPFVRDSENYVNASLIIKAIPSDTSFSYRCDWQYSYKQNNANSHTDSAEYYAIFFMVLDKTVFGHTRFDITDQNLFKQNGKLPLRIRLYNSQSSGRSSLVEPVDFCEDVTITFQDCPYIAMYGQCYGPGGACDNCPLCTGSISYTYCWTEWIETGGGGGGSTGGGSTGGGGGSGGSGGGDGTPPPCPGMPVARMQVPEGCSPGWQPSGGGGGSTTPPDPCSTAQNAAKKMDTLFFKSRADSMLGTIPNLTTETKEKGFAIIKKLRINPYDVTDTTISKYYCYSPISTGTDSNIVISFSTGVLEHIAASLHTHPPTGYAAHSAKDIYDFLEGRVGEESHFIGTFVAAANGSQYALTITDASQASAFLATKNQYLQGTKWNEESDIGKAYNKAYEYFLEKYKGDANQKNLAYEMAMAAVLKQFNTGFTVNKKDAAGNFKPIVVNTTQDPRKPKRTIYTQDCL